ncbi:WD40 repeat-like protein [Piromyces finnis]|uniref:WD40 repeat-like protein n=1 Tax=Piromyces finnis TaxID=1754191 RepID=A0A1Y1VIC1_9FUNG|nr:WD40 repeat-like protein [Piromyces finnis]|eukprot:ORX56083.1 WD40 repeat-like protein [Piromyces finnis]
MSLVAISYNQVFGINNNINNNLFFIDEGMVMFSSGKHLVAYNVDHKVQRFFPICDEGEIDYIAQSLDKSLMVIIESNPGKILLHLFDILNLRKTLTYEIITDSNDKMEIIYASFTEEKYLLFIQTGKPNWTLFLYSFKQSKILSTADTCPEEDGIVKEVIPNYYSNRKTKKVSVVGGHYINVYEYGVSLTKMYTCRKLSQREVYCCHDWITSDSIAAGTSNGRILIYFRNILIQIINYYEDFKDCVPINYNEEDLKKKSIFDEDSKNSYSIQSLNKTKSYVSMANINMSNNNISEIKDDDYNEDDEIIQNKDINLLGTDNKNRIDIISANTTGFYVSGNNGILSNIQYILDKNKNTSSICQLIQSFILPSKTTRIKSIALSRYKEFMFVLTNYNQILKVNVELGSSDSNKFIPVTPAYHVGPVISIDICSRKPIIASCGVDKCVKIWNYFTGNCELDKTFQEGIYSVALHPSGLFMLIGFSDKLRLMSILIDDIRELKEFYIKNCNECKFCFGGHIFAAVNGTKIKLYSTWTYKCIGNLKGHNGKITSLYWTQNDNTLVSAGADGAVYVWDIRTMKRVSEYVCKKNSYNSAICNSDGSVVWVSGNDHIFQEIMGSQVTRELDYKVTFQKVLISYSGRMIFGGTNNGDIIPLRYPLISDTSEFYRYTAHSDSISSLGLTYDAQLLISAGRDGCIFIYNIIDRDENGPRIQSKIEFSNEVLVTRSDLEEQNINISELTRKIEELKLEHEYQMRLKDMNFNDTLKEIVERYTKEIDELKVSSVILKGEKEKVEILQSDKWAKFKQNNHNELQELDTKFTKQLIKQYDKYSKLKNKYQELQENCEIEIANTKNNEKDELLKLTQTLEKKIAKKSEEILKLKAKLKNNEIECNEFRKITEEDIDSEILLLNKKYQIELKNAIDKGFKLKGENGIMKKKFINLNKDIEDSKNEIVNLNNSINKLKSEIDYNENKLYLLKKEMIDRNYFIHDIDKKVFTIKRRNQQLEKEKYVLNYNITKLRQQIEPREAKMEQMKKCISEKNNLLCIVSEDRKRLENIIERMKNALNNKKEQYNKKHRQNHDLHIYFSRMLSDLNNAILYMQDQTVFKKAVQNLYKTYCKSEKYEDYYNTVTPEVINENKTQISVLNNKITDIKKEGAKTQKTINDEYKPLLDTNIAILGDIEKLRESNGLSNKFVIKRNTILQKNKRDEERKKQKGTIKAIATFKSELKQEYTDENNIMALEIKPINSINNNQQLIKTS